MSFEEITKNLHFNFPHNPYIIQTEFSKNLFYALSEKKFSIFESPTGTGKSLSLIMGSCEWLCKNKQNIDFLYSKMEISSEKTQLFKSESDLPDWLNEDFFIENKKESIKIEIAKINQNLNQRRLEYEKIKKNKYFQTSSLKINKNPINKFKVSNDELLNYDSEKEYESNLDEIFKKFKDQKNQEKKLQINKEKTSLNFSPLKIIYASRTHSQIRQFVQEIKKTDFRNLYVVTLGSRKILCINSDINKPEIPLYKINTLCKKVKKKEDEKIPYCPYFENSSDPNLSFAYLDQINDIEEMISQGKKLNMCPYYVSRINVENAEILCVPYVSLFHKRTREKFCINLQNSIIIIDEAHNLLESLCQINSFVLNFRQICQIYSQLKRYQEKYQKKLKAKNLFYVNQLCLFLNKLRIFLQAKHIENKPGSYVSMRILDFLIEVNGSSLDFMKLQTFIENSQLSKKMNMFIDNLNENVETESYNITVKNEHHNNNFEFHSQDLIKTSNNALDIFIDFFIGLLKTNDQESRFLIKFSEKLPESSLNVVRLNPENVLKDVLNECHSMVLAGGTMEPISDYKFIKNIIPEEKYHHFSCGHIISEQQFKAFIIGNLIYNYESKQNPELLINTISIIKDIAEEIPDGLIVFVQSYGFLKALEEGLNKVGIKEKLQGKKIFFDSKNCNKLINDYEKEINSSKDKGAILFSVMGGKLSEGINFNDKLARGIIVLGLPFSNIKSPEVIEKTKFYETKGINYQENTCMKLVNQTIGRAIRHKKDYAIVFLIDKRFENPTIRSKLPSWIREYIEEKIKFDEILIKTKQFFKNIII